MEAGLALAIHLTSPASTADSIRAAVQASAVIPHKHQPFAECVSERESHGNYQARNPRSSAMGRWQFLDRQWRKSLSYMVRDRLIAHGLAKPAAMRVRLQLAATPIATWAPGYQDAAFVAVITADADNWRHWHLPGSRCNELAVAS